MKNSPHNSKSGSILVIVMVILVAFSLMITALLQLGAHSETETIKNLRSVQAHWLAEAGLERALSWIFASESFRDSIGSTYNFSNNETLLDGTGSYRVLIEKSTISSTVDEYTITSTSIVSNAVMTHTAGVRYTFQGSPGGLNFANTFGGDMLVKNSNLSGDLYVAPPGTLHFEGGANSIDGIVDAENITGAVPGDLEEGNLPDPTMEKINRTPYEALLSTASSTNPAVAFQGNYSGTLDLSSAADNTIYVNGDIEINADIDGPGTIVATGEIDFGVNGIEIGDNIKLVANGNISVNKTGTEFGENLTLFTMSNFYLNNNQDYPNIGTTIIAIQDIFIDANMVGYKGIIYAEGDIYFSSGVQNLTGALIAWGDIEIESNLTGTYDPSVFATPNPFEWDDDYVLQAGAVWKQLKSYP